MRRPPILVGAVVCLVVTGGCLGFLGGGTTPRPTAAVPGESSPTAVSSSDGVASPSPTETETASPTLVAKPLPAWTSGAGIESPERFAETHGATLRNTSFVARYSYIRSVGGAVDARTRGIVRYDGNGTVYYNFTRGKPGSAGYRRTELWSNGTVARRAVTTSNGTAVAEARPATDVRTFEGRVNALFRAFETGVTAYSRLGGQAVVRISGSEFNRAGEGETVELLAFRMGFVELTDGSLSATVSEDTLRKYRVELKPSSAITAVEKLAITKLGATTVHRPAWATLTNESRSG